MSRYEIIDHENLAKCFQLDHERKYKHTHIHQQWLACYAHFSKIKRLFWIPHKVAEKGTLGLELG